MVGWEKSRAGEVDPNSLLLGLRIRQGASLGLSFHICEVGDTERLTAPMIKAH